MAKTPKKPGKKGGAPSKYKPEFCQLLIANMSQGYSIEACAALMGVHKDSVYEWIRVYPEFSDAKREGEARARLFWEKVGIAGMAGKIKSFNASVWIFNMKNRFGWRDMPVELTKDGIEPPSLNYVPRKPS